MPDQSWLAEAVDAVIDEKKTHIPYLIFDKEVTDKDHSSYAVEILSHPKTKEIIETLASDNPGHIDHSLILTSSLEIRSSDIVADIRQMMDRQMIGGYYVELNPDNSPSKIRLYRRAEKNRDPHLEITTVTECTSPDNGILTKTEFFNLKGEKISDQYHVQFDKNYIDRDNATEQLSSDFYIHIISELNNTLSSPNNPKGLMIEVGFTSETNGEMPMIVFTSEDENPLTLHSKPDDMSSSVTNHAELLKKYTEIAKTYSEQILSKNVNLSTN